MKINEIKGIVFEFTKSNLKNTNYIKKQLKKIFIARFCSVRTGPESNRAGE